MADPADALIQQLTRIRSRETASSFLDRLGQLVLRGEAARLVEHLERIASGQFEILDATELATILQWFASPTERAVWSLTIAEPLLPHLSESVRGGTLRLLSEVLASDPSPLRGRARLLSTSILKVVEDPLLLRIALQAASRGIEVRVVAMDDARVESPFKLALQGPSGGLVVSGGRRSEVSHTAWSVEAWSEERSAPGDGPEDSPGPAAVEAVISLPRALDGVALLESEENETEVSVADLFGDLISLRDLEPRSSSVHGLAALRVRLGLTAPFVPRKNEKDYASVVARFVNDIVGADARIVYVGDTVFNDGSVICNMDALKPGSVLGFLCNEKGFGSTEEFILGPVYFAKRWRSLGRFLAEARRRGMTIDSRTVGLFDLDQTVYAAKGRDDEALREARWEAIGAFLRDTIPSYKFDAARAEQIYRQFDQDEYHRITRDNMDYVVLLVLAVAAGLCDGREIEVFATSRDNSIAALTELLHQRALARRGHEEIGAVLDVIRAVHYNTLAGDQTPCKEFRRYECRSTALRMRGGPGRDRHGRIFLNREVVDFIRFLKSRGAPVFAVSDRPIEAAVIEEEDGTKEDLMSIPMRAIGFPIYDALVNIA